MLQVMVKTWEWILRIPTMWLMYEGVAWVWTQDNPYVTFVGRLFITLLILGTMGVLVWYSHPLMSFQMFLAHLCGSAIIAALGMFAFGLIPNGLEIAALVLLVIGLIGSAIWFVLMSRT